MRAARYYGKGDIRVEDVAEAQIREPDDVLIAPFYCGICGTDLHEYAVGPIVTPTSPHPLTGVTLPQILGHEFSARVVEVGPAVRDVRVGDRVAIMPAIVCGRCRYCRRGQGHLCVQFACTGLSAETGGLAELAVVKEYQVARLPDEVSDLEGAVVEPAAVAAYGVERAGVTGGDVVLVTGAGPIGILSAMYASAAGASAVIISEPNKNRSALAEKLDIGFVVDPTTGALEDLVAELTGGDGVDLAVECSGSTPGAVQLRHADPQAGLDRADRAAHQAGDARRDGVVGEGPDALRQLVLEHDRLAADHPPDRDGPVPGRQGRDGPDPARRRRVAGLRRAHRPPGRPAQGPRPRHLLRNRP